MRLADLEELKNTLKGIEKSRLMFKGMKRFDKVAELEVEQGYIECLITKYERG